MNSILRRRRALMGASGKDTSLVYNIENVSCEAGTSIDTGVKFLSSDFNGTVLLDINVTSNKSSGNGSEYRPVSMYNSTRFEISIGKASPGSGYLSTRWQGSSWAQFSNTTAAAGRKRIAITHEANSKSVTFKYKDTGSVQTKTETSGTFTPVNRSLHIGAAAGAQGLPASVINKAKIYSRILTTDEINAFFA